MGCCESCFGTDQDKEPNERTPILQSGPANAPAVSNGHQAVKNNTPPGSESNSQPNEDSLLNGILKKYSEDVMDVTAMDTRIDAVEYMNRAQHYNRKLGGIMCNPKESKLNRSGNFKAIIFAQPSIEDLSQVEENTNNISEALKSVTVVGRGELTVSLAHS